MQQIALDRDIRSISELRSKATAFIDQVHKTKRPMVITQNGKSSAVLLDVREYQNLIDQIDLFEEIHLAEKQIQLEKGIPHQKAHKAILSKIQ